jgi:leucine dehydrogenase
LGHLFDERTIPRVQAPVIAGGANNQLGRESDGELLRERGILYAPDYVINGGGIICVHHERAGSTSEDVRADVQRIPGRLAQIFERSGTEHRATNEVANDMARAIVAAGRQTPREEALSA